MKKIVIYAALWLLFFSPVVLLAASPEQEDVKLAAQPSEVVLPNLTGTPWEGWKVPPGTELVVKENDKGEIIKTLSFPGDVVFTHTKRGTLSIDRSGKGAVMCAQMIYVEMREMAKNCPEPLGIPLNLEEAYFWLGLVPSPGPNSKLAASERHRVEKQLTSEQIELINNRIKAWKPVKEEMSKDVVNPSQEKASQYFPRLVENLSVQEKAEQGDAEAQFELAANFEHGLRVQKNFFEAEKWYLRAAKQGYAVAQYSLGKLYAAGGGQMTDEEFISMMDMAIDRINDFIVKNNPTPITKEQLEEKN